VVPWLEPHCRLLRARDNALTPAKGCREHLAAGQRREPRCKASADLCNAGRGLTAVYRGKGQQKVTVEHVHVHSGGQAIVGAVQGGWGVITIEGSTRCTAT
jgi:hypothetical protein